MTMMKVTLTKAAAPKQWGENALLSYTEKGASIHLTKENELELIQKAARKLVNQDIKAVKLSGKDWDLEKCWLFAQGYRTSKGALNITWPKLSEKDETELDMRLTAVNWSRDLINKSAEEISPEQLASRAGEFIKQLDPEHITYKVVKGGDLRDAGWIGTYTVGRGSHRKPAVLRLDYNPSGDPDTQIDTVLVAKGITFDSGGYSLKPSNFMDSMKADMGGSAMAAAALALAIMQGVNKRIKLVLCCAENMVSSKAFKLGDIITYKNGKTVEVMNTDAEGRLVLADGLIYADKQNAKTIIDCATLTGAAKAALGNDYHALLAFDQELANKALNVAESVGEGMWQLPLADMHRNMLSSNFADLSNIASGSYTPGASTAAAFLSHFLENPKKGWMHLDCSATYRKAPTDMWAAGATGVGVRTLAALLMEK